MNSRGRGAEPARRRWLGLAALVALAAAPKCVLCALAYAGVGAVALGGVEMCGATGGRFLALAPWLAGGGLAATGGLVLLARRRARRRSGPAPTAGGDRPGADG